MRRRKVYEGAIVRGGLPGRSAYGRSVRRVCGSVIGLGLVSTLMAEGRCIAQTPGSARLTVRPHEMATGTQNVQGEHLLDSLPEYLVYVPQPCVGTRRCPLVVILPGGGYASREVLEWHRPLADKYGMIVLAPTRADEGSRHFDQAQDRKNVDVALKQTLRKFTIDPEKIAIVGRCASGPDGMILGTDNLDVFSRIIPISAEGFLPTARMDPRNKTVEFFLDAGLLESYNNFKAAQELRRAGHPVKHVLALRGHEYQLEDHDFVGHWLQESWATPTPTARRARSVVADPLPLLTPEALTQMTTFWTSFMQEPDSTRTIARRAHLREITVPVGKERPSVWMVDMSALAAQYPSVAAKLKAAGLTAEQHDAYRVALISASVTKNVEEQEEQIEKWRVLAVAAAKDPSLATAKDSSLVAALKSRRWELPVPIGAEATSVLGKNVAFLAAHPDELQVLEATKMWTTP